MIRSVFTLPPTSFHYPPALSLITFDLFAVDFHTTRSIHSEDATRKICPLPPFLLSSAIPSALLDFKAAVAALFVSSAFSVGKV